jgi:hypothetical protein
MTIEAPRARASCARNLLALAIAACGCGGSAKPAAISTGASCKPAYADYEAKWSGALRQDLADVNFEGNVDEVVVAETATLPRRGDLVTLRATYKIVEAFIADAPWPVAYAAADVAIEQCGEGAARPR